MTATSAAEPHVGIDLGTSSVKVVLLDRQGEHVAGAEASYAVRHPHAGWAESAPVDWWDATVRAVREAMSRASGTRPVSIGLSGQMHGVVATGSDGRPVRDAVLWADSRAEEQLDLYRCLPAETRRRLANPLSPGMAGPVLGWLARHEPEVTARTRWALQPKDWVRLQLTGEVHTDPSDASATLMYDVLGGAWATDVVEALGVDTRVLPPVLPTSGSHAGRLTPTAARALGLPAGIDVAVGAGDTAAAALGYGLVTPGSVQLTIGTGVQVVTPSDQPAASTGEPVTHYYRAATDTGHYRMGAVLNGGLALGWVRETLNASWAELYSSAARTPLPDDPLFLPHLNGERTPYLDASMRGAWTGLTARHTRTDLLRSALEGVAFATAEALTALFPEGPDVDHLRLAGGGTVDPAWRQMLADVLDLELRAVAVPGASGRGAAFLGARAAGLMDESLILQLATPVVTATVRPDPQGALRHRDRRTRFRETVEHLRSAARTSDHVLA
jgi:xylulokinase